MGGTIEHPAAAGGVVDNRERLLLFGRPQSDAGGVQKTSAETPPDRESTFRSGGERLTAARAVMATFRREHNRPRSCRAPGPGLRLRLPGNGLPGRAAEEWRVRRVDRGVVAPLGTLEAFEGWPEKTLRALERHMVTGHFSPAAEIATEALPADTLFLVRSGLVGLTAEASGQRVMVALLGAGDFFSTVGDGEAPCVTPLRAASISALPAALVKRVIHHRPEFGMLLLEQFSARAAFYRHTLACVSHISVRDRLLSRLRHLAQRDGVVTPEGVRLPLELTHRQWALFVGASREAVTLAFGELLRTGRVRSLGPRRWLLPWTELRPSEPEGGSPASAALDGRAPSTTTTKTP
jgi:CRP-like cAMP-binding protein